MQREERMLDNGLDAMIQRVNELRESVNAFILKLENEYTTMDWSSVLDSFALLSSKINMLNKLMRSDKLPLMKNFAVFPLHLHPNRDPELERLTEGRVAVFNHELVPLYLRTKPNPKIEEKIVAMAEKTSTINIEILGKKITTMNKLATNAADQVKSFKENMDSEGSQRHSLPQLCSQTDTAALVAATVFGKGIKSSQRPVTPSSSSTSLQQGAASAEQRAAATAQGQGPGKVPSTIKTNIKSGNMHPYAR